MRVILVLKDLVYGSYLFCCYIITIVLIRESLPTNLTQTKLKH